MVGIMFRAARPRTWVRRASRSHSRAVRISARQVGQDGYGEGRERGGEVSAELMEGPQELERHGADGRMRPWMAPGGDLVTLDAQVIQEREHVMRAQQQAGSVTTVEHHVPTTVVSPLPAPSRGGRALEVAVEGLLSGGKPQQLAQELRHQAALGWQPRPPAQAPGLLG